MDALLTPCAPSAPWVSADTAAQPPLSVYLNDVMTIPASLAGLPAISVPVGHAAYPAEALARCGGEAAVGGAGEGGGLAVPVGLQIIGRFGDEATVLRVAEALEGEAGFKRPAWFEE